MKKIFTFLVALNFCAVVGSYAPVAAQTEKRSSQTKGSWRKADFDTYAKSGNFPKNPTTVLRSGKTGSQTPPASTRTSVPQQVAVSSSELPILLPAKSEQRISAEEVGINISSNGNAIVKIGLSERGVALIDFPANDPVYRIHPGNENFVTVSCGTRSADGKCGTSPNDAIVLRPGENFHALGSEESAATVITVQRLSGIVVSFVVVPVKTVAENSNYTVIRYNLEDVTGMRRKAGLPYNLLTNSVGIDSELRAAKIEAEQTGENPEAAKVVEAANAEAQSQKARSDEMQSRVVAELQRIASTSPALKFSKPVYGLSLAKASLGSRTGDMIIDVVAVRNTLPQAIRLLDKPSQPLLSIETGEKDKETYQSEAVQILHMATTVESDDVLLPGQVYYYAIAYKSPVLGARQSLRIRLAQREASDAPASLNLGGFAR